MKTGRAASTLSIILSITSSERFMPDSARVATTICFTYGIKGKKNRHYSRKIGLWHWKLKLHDREQNFTSCLSIKPCCLRSYNWKETENMAL